MYVLWCLAESDRVLSNCVSAIVIFANVDRLQQLETLQGLNSE